LLSAGNWRTLSVQVWVYAYDSCYARIAFADGVAAKITAPTLVLMDEEDQTLKAAGLTQSKIPGA
jgi:hypothetical protein